MRLRMRRNGHELDSPEGGDVKNIYPPEHTGTSPSGVKSIVCDRTTVGAGLAICLACSLEMEKRVLTVQNLTLLGFYQGRLQSSSGQHKDHDTKASANALPSANGQWRPECD